MRHGRWPRACEAEVEMTGAEAHYDNILVERRGAVGLVTLNRPQALNALSAALIADLGAAFDDLEADPGIAAIVLTGGEKAFAAGADIKEMAGKSYMQAYTEDFITRGWERVAQCRKPVVAAVGGFALGGGCEVAMMCDLVIAADSAKFGQPEIALGVTPGMGGSQRLTRAVGKAKAMEMCLTGRMMNADEAERSGLVARVVPAEGFLDEVMKIAEAIASMAPLAAIANKEMVNAAFEMPLNQGIRFERRLFHAAFATEDQKEGMAAFVEKRQPDFKDR
jgi:enoyl-CoA hydratase